MYIRSQARYLSAEQRGVAQLGRASGLGPEGRWFKSNRPDWYGKPAERLI